MADGRVRLRAYLMRRTTLKFEEIPIEIVPDTDLRMMAVLFGQDGDTTHFLIYAGAMSQLDVEYLLDGFGAESGIAISP